MWGTDSGGHLHSKNYLVSYKQHEVIYMQKLHYCCPGNILTGVARQLFGPHHTLSCVLMCHNDQPCMKGLLLELTNKLTACRMTPHLILFASTVNYMYITVMNIIKLKQLYFLTPYNS